MLPLLLLACSAEPAPAFTVENKTAPAFVVTNRTAPAAHAGLAPPGSEWVRPAGGAWELRKLAAPAREPKYPDPAPFGYKWESQAGGPWELVRIGGYSAAPAPGVPAAVPFPAGTTRAIGAQRAVEPLPPSPAPVPYRAPIGTFVPWTGRGGITENCGPYG